MSAADGSRSPLGGCCSASPCWSPAFLIVPVIFSSVAGVTANYLVGVRGGLTTRWLLEVIDLYQVSILRSLVLACSCVLVTLILGVPLAYGLATRRLAGARIIEELLMLPVAVPGLATGLALILAYGSVRDFAAARSSF